MTRAPFLLAIVLVGLLGHGMHAQPVFEMGFDLASLTCDSGVVTGAPGTTVSIEGFTTVAVEGQIKGLTQSFEVRTETVCFCIDVAAAESIEVFQSQLGSIELNNVGVLMESGNGAGASIVCAIRGTVVANACRFNGCNDATIVAAARSLTSMFFNGCDIGRDVACFASRLVDLSGNVVVGFQNCRFYGPQLDSPNEDVTV